MTGLELKASFPALVMSSMIEDILKVLFVVVVLELRRFAGEKRARLMDGADCYKVEVTVEDRFEGKQKTSLGRRASI